METGSNIITRQKLALSWAKRARDCSSECFMRGKVIYNEARKLWGSEARRLPLDDGICVSAGKDEIVDEMMLMRKVKDRTNS